MSFKVAAVAVAVAVDVALRQVDCMEYKKITVRVGRESYGAGIEFGINPAEEENEDMLREEGQHQ